MSLMENAQALIVGIANYHKINKLPETILKDAEDVYDLLISPQHCGYLSENVQLLLDKQASKTTLLQALTNIAHRSNKDSTIFIYFSSHGGQVKFGSYAGEYLLPVDTNAGSEASLGQTAISGTQFTETLRAIKSQKVIVIFDCCHAGGIGQPKNADPLNFKAGFPEGYYDTLKQGRGRVILASSRSDEFSYVVPGAKNSLFTQHLLDGLRGGVPSEDGLVRIFDLFEYLQPRVTGDQPNQHPIFKAELEENIPVALYLGSKKGNIPQVGNGFRYDAYISYVDQDPDSTWVWETLLPQLEDAGLRIAVSGDSGKPGVARVVNIERGIKLSKRTIVFLSEAYLTNQMAKFENILGQTMGIQEGNYRLLPIKAMSVDTSQLPVRLSMLETLDLSHPRRAKRELERLVQTLRRPLPQM